MTESQNLLAEYVQSGSDIAFRELVTRYVDLVYSAALRMVEGDTHRAEDVAQTVFVDLARLARTLSNDVMLGGWLHRHTCFVAAKIMRGERRRQSRERQAVEMNALEHDSAGDFSLVAPILDEAIDELGEMDRTAILLRFFEQHDFRVIGQAIGSNEDAARMRVTRALEKLEGLLKRRGITTSAATLSMLLTASAVQAAPIGLAVTISTAGIFTGTSLVTAAQAIPATMLKKSVVGAVLAVLIAIGIYEARHVAVLQAEIERLTQHQTPSVDEIDQLKRDRDEATRQLAALRDENGRLNRNTAELLRLRGEVTRLRSDSERMAQSISVAAQTAVKQPLVAGIVVTNIGARLVSNENIRSSLHVKVGDIFYATNVDRDVRGLYASGLFANIRVDDQATDEGVVLTYSLKEKPTLTGLHVTGNTRFPEAGLVERLACRVGDRFDEQKLFKDARELERIYEQSGLPGAKVKYLKDIDENSGQGVATFQIREPPAGDD